MFRTRGCIAVAVLLALAVPSAGALCQGAAAPTAAPRYVFEIEAGIGTSTVDQQKWADTPSQLTDWNMMAYWGSARIFFTRVGRLRVGAEAGHNMFWWWNTRYLSTDEHHQSRATRIGAVARAPLGGRGSADLGPALYIFPDGPVLGANGALGFHFPAGARVSIPVKVRTDLVLGSTTLIAFGANVGVSVGF